MASINLMSPAEKGSTTPDPELALKASRVSPLQSLRSPPPVPLKVLIVVLPPSIEK